MFDTRELGGNGPAMWTVGRGGGIGCLLALALVFGGPSAASAATGSVGREPLGHVTAVAWGVRTPVGARLVLRPSVHLNVQSRALRALRARKLRVRGVFMARIVTRPVRGRGRTLVVRSRRVSGLALRGSGARNILGRKLALRRLVLTRRQTAVVKRAAARGRLAVIASARYRVRYTDARGRTVERPVRSGRTILPVSLKRFRARGAGLRGLAARLRTTIRQVERSQMACVTRNALVERLRITYAVLASGRRSGATELLRAWLADVPDMRAAGLLSAQQQKTLQSGLGAILRRVGAGRSTRVERSRRWPRLPSCESGPTARSAQITIATHFIVHASLAVLKKGIGALSVTLWPEGSRKPATTASVYDLLKSEEFKGRLDYVQETLNNLGRDYEDPGGYLDVKEKNLAYAPDVVAQKWISLQTVILNEKGWFVDKYPKDLLPLFAQYENMYLAFLREAVVLGERFGWLPVTIQGWEDSLKQEMKAANDHVDTVYKGGFPDTVKNDVDNFNNQNGYRRQMQLEVRDFQAMWKLQDPMLYPYDPNLKLTRMIYSDQWGETDHTFSRPVNVDYPLSLLRTWAKDEWLSQEGKYYTWLEAIKVDNAPLVGPITGHSSPTGTGVPTWNVAPGSTPGPVVQVGATWHEKNVFWYPQHLTETVKFYFQNNTSGTSGQWVTRGGQTRYWTFDGHALATARLMGSYKWSNDNYVGDSIIFGFRLADSYYPSGEVEVVGSDKCLDLPSWAEGTAALIATCRPAPSDAQDWTYNSATGLLSTSGGSANGGTRCLKAVGTTVQIYGCQDTGGATSKSNVALDFPPPPTPDQQWTASSDGTIMNVGSGLCLGPAGGATAERTPVALGACTGAAAQQWATPWTGRLPGTMRAPNSQTCLGIAQVSLPDGSKTGSRADGSPLQMHDCNADPQVQRPAGQGEVWDQTWNHNDDSTDATHYRELSVYAGTKCAAPPTSAPKAGDTVQVFDCNGAPQQKWTSARDGTVKNGQSGDPGLCLERESGAVGAGIRLNTCNPGSAAQKWTWPVG